MNITVFTERLRNCRKQKFSSQQAFADAYMEKYGLIRQGKRNTDHNMFGTIQSWEQGKSVPTADALFNICELLDCDADYLLGRIDEKTHTLEDIHQYIGISTDAIEKLHEYTKSLCREWTQDELSVDNWYRHEYYQAFGLYIIDELLCGSPTHHLMGTDFYSILCAIFDDGGYILSKKTATDNQFEDTFSEDQIQSFIDEDYHLLSSAIHLITDNIRDILFENASHCLLPKCLAVKSPTIPGCFSLTINKKCVKPNT